MVRPILSCAGLRKGRGAVPRREEGADMTGHREEIMRDTQNRFADRSASRAVELAQGIAAA